jgi:hypothetical protein
MKYIFIISPNAKYVLLLKNVEICIFTYAIRKMQAIPSLVITVSTLHFTLFAGD